MNLVETKPSSELAGLKLVEPGKPPQPVDQYDAPSQVAGKSQQRFPIKSRRRM